MNNVRIFFTKLGRAKYISHLDMYRCFMRAINKAGLPVWYTEGFSPHIYMTFPLALSLGYESDCECVDMKMIEDISLYEINQRLKNAFPSGIDVIDVKEPVFDQKKICYADYEIELYLTEDRKQTAKEEFLNFINQEQIIVLKRTKKKIRGKRVMKEIDLKPFVKLIDVDEINNGIKVKIRCNAGIYMNINPTLLLDSFAKEDEIDYLKIKRTNIYTEEMEIFI